MRINRKQSFFIALILVAILPIVFLIIFANIRHPEINSETILPIYGEKYIVETKLSDGKLRTDTVYHTIPHFSLINQNGDTVTDQRMRGVVSVADFFFTTCPDMCIDMAKNKRKIQEAFKEDNSKFQIFSFSVNPDFDTPDKLKKYAYENDVNSDTWSLLTGNKPEIYNLARKGFLVTATVGDGGPNDFIHDNKFVLIDRDLRIRGYYDGTSEAETDKLIQDIKKLLVSYVITRKNK